MPAFSAQPSRLLLLSDVHLGKFSAAQDRALENTLIALIDYAAEHEFEIAILGDLFDYWLEYPHAVPALGQRLLRRLQRFNTHHPVLYVTGNHDNWTLGAFQKMGFEVEPQGRLITIDNKQALLLHGDAIGPTVDALSRSLTHRMLRSPYFMKCYRGVLPPRIGLGVMKKISALSSLGQGVESSPKRLDDWSKQFLATNDAIKTVICGHDHVPRYKKYRFGSYLNLGTFYHHRTLAAYTKDGLQLVQWMDDSATLKPYNF